MEHHLEAPQVNRLAGSERGLQYASSIDVGAVGGPQVPDYGVPLVHHNLAERTGDGRIIERDIISRPAPERVDPRLELDFPGSRTLTSQAGLWVACGWP